VRTPQFNTHTAATSKDIKTFTLLDLESWGRFEILLYFFFLILPGYSRRKKTVELLLSAASILFPQQHLQRYPQQCWAAIA
jgi:hypothetical protein